MNKKLNTVLFMLAATYFNIRMCVIFFVLLFLAFDHFIAPGLNDTAKMWGLPIILFVSMGLSLGVYHGAVRLFIRHIDIDRYFTSLFTPRGPGRD